MTVDITETFEGASNGTTVSTSNTAFDVAGGTASCLTFSTTQAVSGTRSMKLTATAQTAVMRRTFTSRAQSWCRVYFFWPTGSSVATNLTIINALLGATTNAQIRVDSTRHLQIRNGTTSVYTFTNAMALDTWYRIEWGLGVGGTTGQQVKLFTLHGTSAIEDSGSQTYSNGNSDRFSLGLIAADTFTCYFDDFQSADTGFLGPSQQALTPAGSASSTGAISALGRSAALVVAGAAASVGAVVLGSSLALAPSGSADSSATVTIGRSAALTVAGSADSTGAITLGRSASLAITGASASTGSVAIQASIALVATGSATATATIDDLGRSIPLEIVGSAQSTGHIDDPPTRQPRDITVTAVLEPDRITAAAEPDRFDATAEPDRFTAITEE